MTRRFTIEVRDYEAGCDPDPLTSASVERHFAALLDNDGSDGIVIVTESEAA